jgi:hypothetical protein
MASLGGAICGRARQFYIFFLFHRNTPMDDLADVGRCVSREANFWYRVGD